MKYPVPEHILLAMALMEDGGFSPYLVGGCVRDHIMGKVPNDYDITVDADPCEIYEIFSKKGYKAEQKGKQFGTVVVYSDGGEIEITPHRTEGSYSDSRHPDDVRFVKDIRQDLARRDFTVNALAMDSNFNIIDEFNGIEDMDKKIIRCIGDPYIRFGEDALRILRAMRFAARFGFDIDPCTKDAMIKQKDGLKNISAERIREELFGILNAPYAYKVLCESADVLTEIIRGFCPDEYLLYDGKDTISSLFSCIYKNSYDNFCLVCEKLKLRSEEYEALRTMHRLYNEILTRDGRKVLFDDKTKIALCEYKTEYICKVFAFSGSMCRNFFEYLESGIYTISKLAVSGGDIAGLGLFPKNETSKILKLILKHVACGEIENTKEAVTDYLVALSANKSE